MKLMRSASRAELPEFKSSRIISPVLLGGVVALTADRAFHRNYWPISLGLLRHCTTSSLESPSQIELKTRSFRKIRWASVAHRLEQIQYYWVIWVTAPAPTVRPPSRIANRSPSSIATGVISSTPIWMLSPGITISVPSGSSIAPVTSVVRM